MQYDTIQAARLGMESAVTDMEAAEATGEGFEAAERRFKTADGPNGCNHHPVVAASQVNEHVASSRAVDKDAGRAVDGRASQAPHIVETVGDILDDNLIGLRVAKDRELPIERCHHHILWCRFRAISARTSVAPNRS